MPTEFLASVEIQPIFVWSAKWVPEDPFGQKAETRGCSFNIFLLRKWYPNILKVVLAKTHAKIPPSPTGDFMSRTELQTGCNNFPFSMRPRRVCSMPERR